MKLIRIPPIQVHCWGGLGSQLFALNAILDLQNRFPTRRIVLISHTGGVTERQVAVEGFISGLEIRIVSDYQETSRQGDATFSLLAALKRTLRSAGRSTLMRIGLLAELNTSDEMSRVRFWVLSVRGHYSYQKVSAQTVKRLWFDSKVINPILGVDVSGVGIHYRLGDLIDLENKTWVSKKRLEEIVRSLAVGLSRENCWVFSDSLDVAAELLCELHESFDVCFVDSEAIEAIAFLSAVEFFVGTNSKISLWIAILRCYHLEFPKVAMPVELKVNIQMLFDDDFTHQIHYY